MDMAALARTLGLGWPERGDRPVQVHCPLHDDRTPSARFYPATSSLYCWTCQASVGPTALYAAVTGIGWYRAVEELARIYSIDLAPDPDEAEAKRLIALVGQTKPPSEQDRMAERRAASMTIRGVGRSWEAVERLLEAYELLDLTDIDAQEWITLAAYLIEAKPSR